MPYPSSISQSNPNFWSLNIRPDQYANNLTMNNPNLVPANYGVMQTNASASPAIPAEPAPINWLSSQFDEGGAFTQESMFGGANGGGWLSGVSNIGGNVLKGYLGLEQLELGKENLALNKEVQRANINNQVQLTNQSLERRHQADLNRLTPEERAQLLSAGDPNAPKLLTGIA